MKLALFDSYLPKFTADKIEWWQSHGYEVRADRYYNPENVLWADVVFFDTCDNNIKSATNPSEAILSDDSNFKPWDMHDMDLSNKKIICRPMDIEVWLGHQNGVDWNLVDDCIFIADHIKDQFMKDFPTPHFTTHVIQNGVNLDRYNFKERQVGPNIGIVSEKWTSKGTDLILQVALKLKQYGDYKFHWLGKWSDHPWEIAYFNEFIEHHKLDFEFTEWIEGDNAVDIFLEDKNFLLHGSHKEGFSYAIAEAMAKGIKPVAHRFYGADGVWPGITWDTIDQACEQITNKDYDSNSYRQYLIDHGYTVEQEMAQIEKIING